MHKVRYTLCLCLFAIALTMTTSSVYARSQVQVAGSSTVLPYARLVADAFGEVYPQYKIPVIETGGSGAGIKEFCKGIGENTVDIANSSRPIKASELETCAAAGVNAVEQLSIGYDGIVIAGMRGKAEWQMVPADIYKSIAAQVFVDGKLEANPYSSWQQVNTSFPDWNISIYIPGEKHGTREVFEEKLLLQGCKDTGAYGKLKADGYSDKAAKDACIAVRKDGAAVDIDGDYSETLARIVSNQTGLGVFGLSFYENNTDRLQLASIDGVLPSPQTIASGEYPVSRPLYMYVKKVHLGVIPGLKEFIDFFLSDQMIGPDGPLAEYGLVPEPLSERQEQRADFAKGKIMAIPQ